MTDAPFVYLTKIIYMIIVTVGHRMLHIFSYPKHNPEYIERVKFWNTKLGKIWVKHIQSFGKPSSKLKHF